MLQKHFNSLPQTIAMKYRSLVAFPSTEVCESVDNGYLTRGNMFDCGVKKTQICVGRYVIYEMSNEISILECLLFVEMTLAQT
jgi:hypothetical protein